MSSDHVIPWTTFFDTSNNVEVQYKKQKIKLMITFILMDKN